MAKYTGSGCTVTFNSSNWSANYVSSVETNENANLSETTGLGDTDKTYIFGDRDTDVTLNLWDDATTSTVWAKVEPTGTAYTLDIYPQGNTSGKPKISGSGIVTNRTRALVNNERVAVTVTIKVSGGLTETTVTP